MYMNIRLKDELAEASRQGSSTPFGSEVAILRTELESERKYKLATGAQQYERSCEYLGELRDRDEKLMVKDAEISKLRKKSHRCRDSHQKPRESQCTSLLRRYHKQWPITLHDHR